MEAWWQGISLAEQIFFLIALPATFILIIQTIMLMFGGFFGGDADLDSDVSGLDNGFGADYDADIPQGGGHEAFSPDDYDSAGLQLFSVRGIMAFLVVCGWSGIAMIEMGVPEIVSIILSVILGFLALVGMAKLLQVLMRLQESGGVNYRQGLGKTASVYLTIPARGEGQGKINLLLGEALGEYWAITEDRDPIRTGESVRIIDVSGGVYTVERT